MRIRVLFLATLLATLAPAAGVRAGEDEATVDLRQAHLFPRPAQLEPQIRFWRAIFTQYSAHQVVLHDAVHLDKVYKVLDFRSRLDDGFSEGELASLERLETDVELDRLRALLLRLHAAGSQPESLTAEERAVYDLWADDPAPDRFLTAADDKRLHSQRGLRERFAEGVRPSRAYFPEMEHIFREEGLPEDVLHLGEVGARDGAHLPRGGPPGRARPPPAHRVVLQPAGVLQGGRSRRLAVHAQDRTPLHARRQPGRRASRSHLLDPRRRALPGARARHARHLAAHDHRVQPRPPGRGALRLRGRHDRHRHHRAGLPRQGLRLRVPELLR